MHVSVLNIRSPVNISWLGNPPLLHAFRFSTYLICEEAKLQILKYFTVQRISNKEHSVLWLLYMQFYHDIHSHSWPTLLWILNSCVHCTNLYHEFIILYSIAAKDMRLFSPATMTALHLFKCLQRCIFMFIWWGSRVAVQIVTILFNWLHLHHSCNRPENNHINNVLMDFQRHWPTVLSC